MDVDVPTLDYKLYEDDFEGVHDHIPDIDDVTPEYVDMYISAEVNLPFGGMARMGRVKSCAMNAEGELTGTANSNPILDMRTYEVSSLMVRLQSSQQI